MRCLHGEKHINQEMKNNAKVILISYRVLITIAKIISYSTREGKWLPSLWLNSVNNQMFYSQNKTHLALTLHYDR